MKHNYCDAFSAPVDQLETLGDLQPSIFKSDLTIGVLVKSFIDNAQDNIEGMQIILVHALPIFERDSRWDPSSDMSHEDFVPIATICH